MTLITSPALLLSIRLYRRCLQQAPASAATFGLMEIRNACLVLSIICLLNHYKFCSPSFFLSLFSHCKRVSDPLFFFVEKLLFSFSSK